MIQNEIHGFGSRKTRRKRGGQKGNQNARKHGFYSPALSLEEICEFYNLIRLHGVTPEIAVLRIRLQSLLQHGPANHRLLGEASRLLSQLLGYRYRLGPQDTRQLKTIIEGILECQTASLPSRSLKTATKRP